MRRRDFLVGLTTVGALAGCPSSPGESDATDTATYWSGPRDTETSAPPPDSISWPDSRVLPRFPEPADSVDLFNVNAVGAHEQLMLTTLQGVVNKERPRLYLAQRTEGTGSPVWIDDADISFERQHETSAIIDKYVDEAEGQVVYDPELPDTINVATTIAGVEEAVVVSPSQAERLESDHGVETITDLQGQFTDRIEAYQWAIDNYWSETTDRFIAGLKPANRDQSGPAVPSQFTILAEESTDIRDGSNKDTYTLELTEHVTNGTVYLRFDDALEDNGWGANVFDVTVTADDDVVADFAPGTEAEQEYLHDEKQSKTEPAEVDHRFADASAYFVYEFEVPEDAETVTAEVEMSNQYLVSAAGQAEGASDTVIRFLDEPLNYFRDYVVANEGMAVYFAPGKDDNRELFESILEEVDHNTPYLGWFPSGVAGETDGTALCSEFGSFVSATDFFTNGTVWSGTRAEFPEPPAKATPELENKVYVMIMMTEGDNLQYCQGAMKANWDDLNRGEVPVTWSVSPLLRDIAPEMLHYYLDTATENDYLICGPSGVGYMYPDLWPGDSLTDFAELSKEYMDATWLNSIYALNRSTTGGGHGFDFSEEVASTYEDVIDPLGVTLNWVQEPETGLIADELPQSTGYLMGEFDDPEVGAQQIVMQVPQDWNGDRPVFLSVGLFGFTNSPTDVKALDSALGDNYELVRGDTYFRLAAKAMRE